MEETCVSSYYGKRTERGQMGVSENADPLGQYTMREKHANVEYTWTHTDAAGFHSRRILCIMSNIFISLRHSILTCSSVTAIYGGMM